MLCNVEQAQLTQAYVYKKQVRIEYKDYYEIMGVKRDATQQLRIRSFIFALLKIIRLGLLLLTIISKAKEQKEKNQWHYEGSSGEHTVWWLPRFL